MTSSNLFASIEALEYGSSVTFKAPWEIVYLEYPPSQLAAKPSSTTEGKEEWTRFVCISDTHARTFNVPDGDVLLHGGDLTNLGTEADFQKTMDWLCGLPHKMKIIIAGNHDLTLHADWYEKEWPNWHARQRKQNRDRIMNMLKGDRAKAAGIVYLEDEQYKFKVRDDGRVWSIYGSPWSPWFHNWAFNYERENGKELVAKFPKTDILMTHGPVHQIFDRVTVGGEDVGCEALRARLPELRPRLHLAGHIHEAHGAYIHTWDPSDNYELPIIQNDDPRVLSDQTISDDVVMSDGEATGITASRDSNTMDGVVVEPTKLERTVFVNAANWPMGHRAKRNGQSVNGRTPFGGPGFQAVVVDLKD